MGCDIHAGIEVYLDGKWMWYGWSKHQGRQYDAFAILADVRNGVAFAGADTGDGFKPLSDPKGIPDGASEMYMEHVKRWGRDGHSHSYHTLEELRATPEYWKQTTKHRAFTTMLGYSNLKANKTPVHMVGGVWGKNIHKVSNVEMEALLASGMMDESFDNPTSPLSTGKYYTQVEWEETYEESVPLIKEIIQELDWITEEFNIREDHVRLVFFFDN
jgi:hypothetical protein